MNAAKQYVGSGKKGKFEQINIGIELSKLPPANERGYINLVVSPRKEIDKYGNSHTVYVNDWKPNSQTEQQVQTTQTIVDTPGQDLPF